jgi:hypothetical protein
MYNGDYLKSDQHRKTKWTGVIDGCKFEAKYVLTGLLRVTHGFVKIDVGSDGKTMTGTFNGTIANDKGTITAERID